MSEYDAPDNPPDLFALDDEADGQLSPHDDDLIAQPYTGALDRLSATERPRHKPRLKKRRTLAILLPLMVLALISTVFGMMMAVAADLPSLEQLPQTENRKNSELYDIRGHKIGTLASNEGRIIVKDGDIGAYMKYAVIATEDQRFYENSGVDLKGIARAFVQDVTSGGKAVQGGSTITQQFVKVATKNQDKRTIFNKLRESALAYHITHKWTKDKILTEYLNSIYFGNGAYGIESAARTYFSSKHPECGNPEIPIPGEPAPPCARVLVPGEAAMLAAVIASPSAYDPVAHPVAARDRRDMVLGKMLAQNRITKSQYDDALTVPIPDRDDIRTPKQDSIEPYFTSWVRQVLVDRVGAQKAFEGGLKVQTTIDLDLQKAARDAIANNLYRQDGSGPTAALVAIDNATGEVRAMVGGKNERDRTNSVEDDYQAAPFNLATQGQRQPGSAIKPFILATALENGIGPGSVWPSRKRTFGKGGNKFPVKNFGGFYYGNSTLANALTRSDNAVFAAVGIKVGTKKVAATANRMGIRTPISTNYAMTLGGLKQGVTPLDMAHAYETFAEDGELVTGSLAANDGPVGIKKITSLETGDLIERNKRVEHRAISAKAARISRNLLEGPVKFGTAKLARIPGQVIMGKTGTTENNGDAWFVGFTKKYTVAVWVGYPDSVKSMNIDYFGKEVTGGTFPAAIWRQFMLRMLEIDESRAPKSKKTKQSTLTTGTIPAAPTDTAPAEAETETATTPPAATTTPTPTTTTTPMTPVQPQTGTGPTGGTGTLP